MWACSCTPCSSCWGVQASSSTHPLLLLRGAPHTHRSWGWWVENSPGVRGSLHPQKHHDVAPHNGAGVAKLDLRWENLLQLLRARGWRLLGGVFSFQGFPLELTSTQAATHGCVSMLKTF